MGGYRLPFAAYNNGNNNNVNAYRPTGFAAAVYYGGDGSSGRKEDGFPQSGPQVWGLARKKKKKKAGKTAMADRDGEFNFQRLDLRKVPVYYHIEYVLAGLLG